MSSIYNEYFLYLFDTVNKYTSVLLQFCAGSKAEVAYILIFIYDPPSIFRCTSVITITLDSGLSCKVLSSSALSREANHYPRSLSGEKAFCSPLCFKLSLHDKREGVSFSIMLMKNDVTLNDFHDGLTFFPFP